MPGALLSAPRHLAPALLLALGSAALLATAAPEAPATAAQVAVEVPASKTRTVRLRRLPQGAVVAVAVSSSGALQVALVSAAQLKSDKPQALFRGALERRLSFQVVIPRSGDYYLVLDNRRGIGPVKVTTTIRAQRGRATPKRDPVNET